MAPELILINEISIIIVIVLALVLFGGSRIAGVGKGAGRAIREFKEETKSLDGDKKSDQTTTSTPAVADPVVADPPVSNPTDAQTKSE